MAHQNDYRDLSQQIDANILRIQELQKIAKAGEKVLNALDKENKSLANYYAYDMIPVMEELKDEVISVIELLKMQFFYDDNIKKDSNPKYKQYYRACLELRRLNQF